MQFHDLFSIRVALSYSAISVIRIARLPARNKLRAMGFTCRAHLSLLSNQLQEGINVRKVLISLGLLLGYIGLAGCNTMSGLGKDVETGGEKLENAADRAKK